MEGAPMLPLYTARIEDLGQGDFVKVDRAACHHVALLAPEFPLRLGLNPQTKEPRSKNRSLRYSTDRLIIASVDRGRSRLCGR
jgi:hypothetical protein